MALFFFPRFACMPKSIYGYKLFLSRSMENTGLAPRRRRTRDKEKEAEEEEEEEVGHAPEEAGAIPTEAGDSGQAPRTWMRRRRGKPRGQR